MIARLARAARLPRSTSALLALAAVAVALPLAGGELGPAAARAALGRDASVALLDVEGRRVLVGFGAGAVSLLSELPPEGGRP